MLVGCKYLALRQQMYLHSRKIYNWNFDNHIIFKLVISDTICNFFLTVYIYLQRNKTIGRKDFFKISTKTWEVPNYIDIHFHRIESKFIFKIEKIIRN